MVTLNNNKGKYTNEIKKKFKEVSSDLEEIKIQLYEEKLPEFFNKVVNETVDSVVSKLQNISKELGNENELNSLSLQIFRCSTQIYTLTRGADIQFFRNY